jgi:hypothetical protein
MGFAEAFVPILFFIVSVFGIATSSIAVKVYLDDVNKPKDANYWFSVTMLIFSIIGLLFSGFMTARAFKGGAGVPGTSASGAAGGAVNLTNPNATAAALTTRKAGLEASAANLGQASEAAAAFGAAIRRAST